MKKMMFNDRYGLTKAVLEKRKTVTRRLPIIPKNSYGGMEILDDILTTWDCNGNEIPIKPPYITGEIVAVAQSYYSVMMSGIKVPYKFDINLTEHKGWGNKMYVCADLMPHQIRIIDVRAERLQDITDDDCLREGIYKDECKTYFNGYAFELTRCEGNHILATRWYKSPRKAFADLIDKISGKGTWNSNPFVWRIEFELVK